MSRLIAALVMVAMVVTAFGQGTFTIRRPIDGATVREDVNVLIPKNSIPEGGYLGIFLNDRFIEAVIPEVVGENYVYTLDTKERDLPDGEHKIEVVLYVDFGDQPRVVDRSSITIDIDNSTSIPIPFEGLRFRYNFVPGREIVYEATISSSVARVSQADRELGSRPATIPLEEVTNRFLYAIDNRYQGGEEGLLRMQALPAKGKDYDVYPVGGGLERFFQEQMQPTYIRMTSTGREVFSGTGVYFGFEGVSAQLNQEMLLLYKPLPILPTQPISPGDVWQAAFLEENFTIGESLSKEEYTETFPGRGVFEGVEYQNGRRTAKLRYTRAISESEIQEAGGITQVEGELVRVEEEILVWFDLDEGIVVREERNSTEEFLVSIPVGGGGFAGQGGTPGGFGPEEGPGGGMEPAGMPPGMSGPGGRRDIHPFSFSYRPRFENGVPRLFQSGPRGGVGGGIPPGMGGPGRPGGAGPIGAGAGRGTGTGGGQVRKEYLLLRQSWVMTLEEVN
ncbi:MAG: hypothetical protein ACOCX1_04515 [Fimbriimonadaceae bacterium]